MPINDYQTEFAVLDDLSLVRINVRGKLDYEVLSKTEASAQSLKDARAYNRLYDFRNCNLSMSMHDIYVFTRTDTSMQSVRSKVVKVAMLIAENNDFMSFKFCETTAHNLGFNIRVFTSEESALGWVVKKPEVNNEEKNEA